MDRGGGEIEMGFFTTPWGEGTVSVQGGRLVGVELPPLLRPATSHGRVDCDPLDREALDKWRCELEAYFNGERLGWSQGEIPLDDLFTGEFERAVCTTLLSVPPACTVSYGALARMAGYPRAARAVGNVMAANPIPVVVPCHRVIRADGTMGKYGTEPAWKERLLSHERERVERQTAKR